MNKRSRFIVFAVLFVLIAVIGSYFLLPSSQQMALNNYKDKQYDEALKIYEQQFAAGNLSIDTVSSLTKVYLQYAKIDEAIAVMEKFVAQNPSNLEARQELGLLYQYGQRTDDYVRNLEIMNELAASSESMKKLMETYNLQDENAKNIPFMMTKILEENKGDLQEHRNLANILASSKQYSQSLAVLQLMKDKFQKDMLFSDYELMLRMYVELSKAKEAEEFSISLVLQPFTDDEFARISNILLFLVSPDAAYNYVDALPEKVQNGNKVFEQRIIILQAIGKKETAYELAFNKYQAGNLPNELIDDLILLASFVGNDELRIELRDKINYETIGGSDILGLLDVAREAGDKVMLERLSKRGKEIVAETGDQYLAVMLALSANGTHSQAEIVEIMESEQSLARRLSLAQLCALRSVGSCVDAFFAKIPEYEEMSDAELLAVIGVLQQSRRYDKAFDLADKAIKERESTELQAAWFPLAAIFCDSDVIKPYLVEAAPFAQKTYRDAYYLTMDKKRYDNAILIAEYLYGQEKNDLHHSFVAQAYLLSGNYEQALPLLRSVKDKVKNGEDDYLFVLVKLSKSNPAYGAELRKYGVGVLAGNASAKRKQAIIGALVAGGQQGAIMPYIRSMALASPRTWAYVYAQYLQKNGSGDQVAAFWQEVAARHSGDVELRRQIAYNVLENGDKAMAIQMFVDLCEDINAKPNDDIVKQLVYLWSPIYPDEGIVWLNNRAASAVDDSEKRDWLILMANGTSDEGLLDLVKRQPALLNINTIENRYIDSLAKYDNAALPQYLSDKIATSTDAASLLNYAKLAQSYGLKDEARAAYDLALKKTPENPLVLSKAGVFAASEADYSQAKQLLNQYFAKDLPQLPNTAEAYRAHFYQAESLRRDGDLLAAKPYYEQVVSAGEAGAAQDEELQSLAATSMARLGNKKQAIASFQKLIAANPNNRQFRADYSAMLVDAKKYDLAEKSLPVWREKMEGAQNSYEPANVGSAENYTAIDGGSKVLVANYRGDVKQIESYPWVSYVVEGRDELLIVANDGVELEAMQGDAGAIWLHPKASLRDANYSEIDEKFVVQNQLINARIKVEDGHGYEASQQTRALVKQYPHDAQVLGFAANVENFNGNWPYARRLINQAHDIQPRNEDIIELQRGIERLHSSSLYVDGSWRSLGKSNEYIGSVGTVYDINENVQVGIDLQNDTVRSDLMTLSDGRTGKFNDEKQRGEAYLRYFDDEGDTTQISLLGNNNEVGAAAYYRFANILGLTNLGIEFQRPDWQFVQGVLDDATRNSVFVDHRYSPINPVIINGHVGLNQYNTRHGNNLSSTALIQGSVAYRLKETPYVAVSYNLDAEYELSEKNGRLANGQPFQLFPMDSREVHSVGVLASHDFDLDTNVQGIASYGYERIDGQSGPAVEGKLTHYLDDKWGVQAHAGYGFRGGANDGSLSQGGVRLMYRY